MTNQRTIAMEIRSNYVPSPQKIKVTYNDLLWLNSSLQELAETRNKEIVSLKFEYVKLAHESANAILKTSSATGIFRTMENLREATEDIRDQISYKEQQITYYNETLDRWAKTIQRLSKERSKRLRDSLPPIGELKRAKRVSA